MSEFNIGIIASAFTAGLLSFFSPCIFPLLPVYIGYFSTDEISNYSPNKRVFIKLIKTLLFVAGISVVFFLLGFSAGALGGFLSGATFSVACGILIFIFGLHHAGLINIPILENQKKLNWEVNGSGYLSVFLLGVLFSFGWTPCVGPVLASVLSLTAENGSALMGGWLLLIYSLGLSIPFLVISLGASILLTKIKKLNRYLPKIKLVGGLLIAIMGLWMVFTQVQTLEQAAGNSSQTSFMSQEVVDQGEDFTLSTVNGETVNLSDYRGKPVAVKFWGTWCPSCLAGLESFQELAQEVNSSNDAVMLSIAAPGFKGEMDSQEFIDWAKAQQLTFPILLDEGAKINQKYDLKAYPSYLFFDKNGNLAETKLGDLREGQLKEILEKLGD